MTEPTGDAPNPQAPQPPEPATAPPPAAAPAPPPAAAPAPPPAGGNWSSPPPSGQTPGGFSPNLQQAAVEAGPAPGVVYADIVTRIIALIIDSVILWIPYVILSTILVGAFFLSGGAMYTIMGLVVGAAYAALAGVYFVWTWTTQRASYGQKFLKLETVNAADGATLTRDQAIKRFAFLYGGNLVAIVGQTSSASAWDHCLACLGSYT